MEEHRASMQTYKKVHTETVRSELRMSIVQQSMEMDIWEIKQLLAERADKKSDYQNNMIDIPLTKDPIADIMFIEDTTKFMAADKSGEDGSNLEEFRVASGVEEEALITPIMVVEDLGQNLLNNLSEVTMEVESEGISHAHGFPNEPDVGQIYAQKVNMFSGSTWDNYEVVRQSRNMFKLVMELKCTHNTFHRQSWRHLWGHAKHGLRTWLEQNSMFKPIMQFHYDQQAMELQVRIWDPGITQGDILKQHLEDKVFLGAGVGVLKNSV